VGRFAEVEILGDKMSIVGCMNGGEVKILGKVKIEVLWTLTFSGLMAGVRLSRNGVMQKPLPFAVD
jgi:hypothetical protein